MRAYSSCDVHYSPIIIGCGLKIRCIARCCSGCGGATLLIYCMMLCTMCDSGCVHVFASSPHVGVVAHGVCVCVLLWLIVDVVVCDRPQHKHAHHRHHDNHHHDCVVGVVVVAVASRVLVLVFHVVVHVVCSCGCRCMARDSVPRMGNAVVVLCGVEMWAVEEVVADAVVVCLVVVAMQTSSWSHHIFLS